jgi:hypothetical protein
LPYPVQSFARQAFKRFENDPSHPGLRFKSIRNDVWSVRVGIGYRALGRRISHNEIVWFWIGTRADYGQIIKTI